MDDEHLDAMNFGRDVHEIDSPVKRFAEAAAEMGRYQAANDANRDEFSFALGRLEAAFDELVLHSAQGALEPLLRSEDQFIRVYAAKYLLPTNEKDASAVLSEIARLSAPRNVAATATLIQTHWRLGFLFPKRRQPG